MKIKLLTIALTLCSFQALAAQTADRSAAADAATIDSIIGAVYDVISGDAGQARDWERFRTLFHRDARLIPTGKNSTTGVTGARAMTPEDYIKGAQTMFAKEGFHESEKARRVDIYGNIAHVFSTYEARGAKNEKQPFMRGINSFQLLNDGKRWWVMNIFWQAETPDTPIPKKYLKNAK